MRVLYANASKLMGTLKIAKNKETIETELKKIEKTQLLILDDLFLVPLDAKERAPRGNHRRQARTQVYHRHITATSAGLVRRYR